ncbi:MAG: penicillin-binding protein 2 [Deltaproteobacteria bacterium]|nr:penicillin-binding protein 2 [Deltaproteobacteria bacterium]
MFIAVAAFVILLGRLLYLQVIQGASLRKLSETNSIRLHHVAPTRGLIFDRSGKLLVDNRPAFELNVILKDAKPVEKTIENLAHYIDVPAETLLEKIEQSKPVASYKPIALKHDIGRDTLAVVAAHSYELPGITIDVKPMRHYIENQRASHLIGYLSEINADELASGRYKDRRAGDYIGKSGVEKRYETYLKGERGGRQVEVNAVGQVVRVLKTVPATPGHNVFLTIDDRVQQTAETLLDGKAGAVVAIAVETGEVLALASAPAYDPNAFVCGMSQDEWQALIENPYKPLDNKAVNGEYPPASVYKLITSMAGLEEGVIDETTQVFCPGFYTLGNRVFRCWKKYGHGHVGLIKAIAESCDVYFYQLGRQLGVDRIAWYASACGFGNITGIDFDHEPTGLIPTVAWKKRRFGQPWYGGETLAIAIGQGYNLVTPLQAAVVTAALANGGTRLRPQIVQAIRSAEGETLFQSRPKPLGALPVSAANLELIRKGMYEVVQGASGTARIARLKDIDISGKTGTAQVVSLKRDESDDDDAETPEHLKDHAWFVAFAPSDAPRIAVAVMVEHGEHGSSAAAPIARDVIQAYLVHDRESETLNDNKDASVRGNPPESPAGAADDEVMPNV